MIKKQGQARVVLSSENGTVEELRVKCNFEKIFLKIFLQNDITISDDFIVVGSSFQMLGAATEKAHLPRFSLVLRES